LGRSRSPGTLLSEAELRGLAGPVYYERGMEYFARGAVVSIGLKDGKVAATVQGTHLYRVRLWAERDNLGCSCTCPLGQEGEACKHVVAAGLAWLADGNRTKSALAEDEASGVGAFLSGLDRDALAKLILERAEEDDALAAWLLVKAQSKGLGSPKAALRAIERAFRLEGDIDYDDTATVVAQAEQAADLLEAMLNAHDWSAAAELSEYALRLGFGAMEQVDDSDGELGTTLERIADIHARACGRGGVRPPQLADRLFALIMEDPCGVIAPDPYRKALGRDGMDRFRDSVRREWEKLPALKPGSRAEDAGGERYTLTALMRWLAEGSRDIDALVAIEQRDLSHPGAFLRIAELLKKARRNEDALAWAERGAASFPGAPTMELRDFLVTEYQRRKQHDRALALRWEDFEKRPSLESYRALGHCAEAAKGWPAWRERALDSLRSKAADGSQRGNIWGAGTVLTEIHLAEGDLPAALAQARASNCHRGLWFAIAAACEAPRPDDAIAIYLEYLESIIDGRNDRAYDEAAMLLGKIGTLMRRQGQAARFLDALGRVQTRHKAKRNLMQRLERVAAEARKQGPG
jgi:uncharacterized Zn finger protein